MSELRLILFDDAIARDWEPFALTRPAGELFFGTCTLRERAERFANAPCVGHLAGDALVGFTEEGAPPGIVFDALEPETPRLFLSSRAVPEPRARFALPGRSGPLRIGDEVAGWYAAPGDPAPAEAFLSEPSTRAQPVARVPGFLLRHVWELVTRNGACVRDDFEAAGEHTAPLSDPPEGTGLIAHVRGALRMAPGVHIEPGVVLDFSDGPIWLDAGVRVRAFTRLAGPAYVGPGSTILGGDCSAISIGPVCKVHGEIEACVVSGYANKAHDGFLGHAYLGRWVNLGALTTNSDLKNNYGNVRMWTPHGEMDTGELKLGCLLGDHVKTGIGLMLNTGTVVGAGSNLFGAIQPPRYVPPFCWGRGDALVAYDPDRFLTTAEAVMARRGVRLESGMRDVLRRAWQRATR